MAGSHPKYRHLGRNSAHRKALLRNLVTALIRHESIQTTWPKAKEAQRMAEKLITLAKRGNETAFRSAQGTLYNPNRHLPKLFGELRQRYLDRPGGYTRVLHIEPRPPKKNPFGRYAPDQAPAAILELVDGPKDMRAAVTAAAVARDKRLGRKSNDLTMMNVAKVTRYRPGGMEMFEKLVERMATLNLGA